MKFTNPPIKEPFFISGNTLSPVWVRWFTDLLNAVQTTASNDSAPVTQVFGGEQSTEDTSNVMSSPMLKEGSYSSNSLLDGVGADLVMAMTMKSNGKEEEAANMQTLYWMGV